MRSIYTHKQIKKWKAEVLHHYPSSVPPPLAALGEPGKYRQGACESQIIIFASEACSWRGGHKSRAKAGASEVGSARPVDRVISVRVTGGSEDWEHGVPSLPGCCVGWVAVTDALDARVLLQAWPDLLLQDIFRKISLRAEAAVNSPLL